MTRKEMLDRALELMTQAAAVGQTRGTGDKEFTALLFDTLRVVCAYLEEIEKGRVE